MQTFLPYAGYDASARVLDNKRLGKQRSENLQILKALKLPDYGWKHHTATAMWRGYEHALGLYHACIVSQWLKTSDHDITARKFLAILEPDFADVPRPLDFLFLHCMSYPAPPWLGDERVHKTHRSNLLRKDWKHYGQFGWTEPSNLCYYWPVK